MTVASDEEQRAARTRVTAALAVFALVLVLVIAGLIWAGQQTAPTEPAAPAPNEDTAGPAVPASPPGTATGGFDAAAETALASRPMRQFPDSAALPQTLAATSLPVIAVPTATRSNATGVGEGFPNSPEGAIGQLAALEVVGLRDLDPQTYNAAYASISLPGAPDPATTPLGYEVARNYEQVVGSGGTTITSRWQLAGAQVRGVTNGGRSVVACVSGQLQAAAQNTAQVATGDCQVLRWTGTDWRIAPVPPAARAPITWPGSTASNQAGYRPTDGGPQ